MTTTTTRPAPLPFAVRDCYPNAVKATFSNAFVPRVGWIHLDTIHELTRENLEKMKRRGATVLALTITRSERTTVLADFQVAELGWKPTAPSNERLEAMTPAEALAAWKKFPTPRVWRHVLAAVDRNPGEKPGDLIRLGETHLGKLDKRPRGGLRYRTFVRSRKAWTRTTYPLNPSNS